jgi:hypothetical protein
MSIFLSYKCKTKENCSFYNDWLQGIFLLENLLLLVLNTANIWNWFFFNLMTLEIKFDKRVTNIRMHFSIILFSRIYKENLKQTQPYLTYNFKPCVLNLSILHKCYWLVLNYLILIAWSLPYALSIVSQHFSHLF